MRKDVKFIFAIGAILLAALIVYVFVVPAGEKKGQPIAGTTPESTSGTSGTSATGTLGGATPATQPSWTAVTSTTQPTESSSGFASATTQPTGGTSVAIGGATTQPTGSGYATANDPFRNSYSSASTTQPTGAEPNGGVAMSGSGGADGKNVDWGRLLQTGQYSATHDGSASTGGAAGTPSASGAYASNTGSRNGTASLFAGSSTGSGTSGSMIGGTGSTGSTTGGQRTHVVKAGETLTSIAQAEYGDGSQYNKILAANPKVDPRRIKVGQSLIIPDASASATPAAATSGGTGALSGTSGTTGTTGIELGNGKKPTLTKAEPKTGNGKTYTVQAGDSLQKIAAKVYGSTDKWEKIYQANKAKIGSNPQHIRAGQVLQIPAEAGHSASQATR